MYNYEELKEKKYAELLIISKSLGLKCGRTKAEKVIKAILSNQSDVDSKEKSLISTDEDHVDNKSSEPDVRNQDNSIEVPNTNPRVTKRRRKIEISTSVETPEASKQLKKSVLSKSIGRRSGVNRKSFVPSPSTNKVDITPKSLRRSIAPRSSRKSSAGLLNDSIIKPQISENVYDKSTKNVNEPSTPASNKSNTSVFHSDTVETPQDSSCESKPQSAKKSESKALVKNGERTPSINDKKNVSDQLSLKSSVQKNPQTPKFTIGKSDTVKDTRSAKKSKATHIPRFLSYVKKIKNVPDFKKIHEKNFGQMQDLAEIVEEKKKRNKAFFAIVDKFKKPNENSPGFKPSIMNVSGASFNFGGEKNSSKVTNTFNFTNVETTKTQIQQNSSKENSVLKSQENKANKSKILKSPPVKKTPSSTRRITSKSPMSTIKKLPTSTKRNGKLSTVNLSNSVKKSATSSITKKFNLKSPARVDKKILKTTNQSSVKTMLPVSTNNSKNLKENKLPEIKTPMISRITSIKGPSTPGSLQKRKEYNPASTTKKPLGYKPYTGALKPLHDRETLKKMANRTAITKTSGEIKERQKNILKGVRTNKRFELQMAKRGL